MKVQLFRLGLASALASYLPVCPHVQAQGHVRGFGKVVAGDDRREIQVEQVRRGIAFAAAAAQRAGDLGVDLGPYIRQRDAGGEVPAPGPGVPGLEQRGQRESHLALHVGRDPLAQGHVATAADLAVQIDLGEIHRPDRLGRNDAGVGLHAGARDLPAERALGGVHREGRGQRRESGHPWGGALAQTAMAQHSRHALDSRGIVERGRALSARR